MNLEEIFKAYDIRGTFPEQVNPEFAERLGRALVSFFKCKKIGVARDMRLSGEALHSALCKGIISQGCSVIDFGLCATDEFYFCIAQAGLPAGVMVTASHNPKQYNGFKIVGKKAWPIGSETGLEKIKNLVLKNSFKKSKKKGKIIKKDFLKKFAGFCLKTINKKKIKPLRVVVDFGNGMASLSAMETFKQLPLKIVPLCFGLDGNFPNHEANPLVPENRKDIEEKVLEENADFGIAFDGDADRCFFIDNNGKFVPGDFVLALLAKKSLQKNSKGLVLIDVRASKYVRKIVEENNGKWVLNRVGHSFFKKNMKEKKAIFGGEISGHYYYRLGGFVADNAIVAALHVIELVSDSEKKFSELMEDFSDSFFTSGEINSSVADKEAKMKELEAVYKKSAKKIFWLDGVTVEFEDWWFNIRPSNTEPLLRLNLEANSKELLDEKLGEVLKIIRE